MSTPVTLLAFGSQGTLVDCQNAKIVVCDPVDVSLFSMLRLVIQTQGLCDCSLRVSFDHSPDGLASTFTQFAEVNQGNTVAIKNNVVLTGFQNFVRVRYLAMRNSWSTAVLQLGISGNGF